MTFMTTKQNGALAGLLFVLALVIGGPVNDRLSYDRLQGYARYRACVVREYGMQPIRWYEDNDLYPKCQSL